MHTLQPLVIGVITLGLTFVTIFVFLRLYTKFFIIQKIRLEDVLCFIAWLLFVAFCGLGFLSLKYGAGIPQSQVSLEHAMKVGELANIEEALYSPLIALIKVSILLQLIHIFVPNRNSFKFYLIQGFIWFHILFYTAAMFAKNFQCTPRAKIWNSTLPGTCINSNIDLLTSGIINVVSDILILLLPVSWVYKLQMPMRRKIGVSAVFAAAIFMCVASIMRLVESVKNGDSNNATYRDVPVSLWVGSEVTTGLLISNLPTLPRFFGYVVPKINTRIGSRLLGTRRTTLPSEVSNGPKPHASWQNNQSPYLINDKYHELPDRGTMRPWMTAITDPNTSDDQFAHDSGGSGSNALNEYPIKKAVDFEQQSINLDN